jgi:replicative DNA helicase Mcm
MTAEGALTDSALADKVKEFLTQFKDPTGSFSYVEQIDQMIVKQTTYVVVDFNDLVSVPVIESKFIQSADEILHAFSRAIYEILKESNPEYAEKIKHDIRARIANFPDERSLRQINSEVITKMISVSGMVVRASEVKPLAKEVTYKCLDKHISTFTLLDGMSLNASVKCQTPNCKHTNLALVPEESRFIDFQIVRLQELPEDLPPGQLPHYVNVSMKQDLVDYARPGDRIVLTGIVRIEQERISGVKQSESALYRLRIDGDNIEFIGGKGTKSSRRTEREEISPDEQKIIKTLAKNDDIYNRLIESFAPHIRGHEIFKEAILLLIVGSTQRALSDGSKVRGDINVFLVGDPGTAKSEMLKFCARIAPRGLYTSGRGSTAAGLTAAVVRDTSGIFMLEAGAVVLGDQGLVCIDEFDKMRPEDRSALHEVMEQQSASIAKGGIVATLNARTSILAAANPMFGKYDPFKNLTENVNLPIPLLTRFDLVFVVRDIPGEEKDRQIAEHIISQHGESGTDTTSLIDVDILTKYLAYAKRIDPALTKEAESKIMEFYLKMRSIEGEDKEKMITITPRQLEGLIRLATARARLLLKNQVEGDDAERAIYLFNKMLENSGIDVNTGKVDIGVLQGRPRSEVSKLSTFMETLRSLEGDDKSPVLEQDLVDELIKSDKFKDEDEVKRFIRKMNQEASIYESKPGHWNTV